jgi:cell wall-associated NlpC family hydrolase
MSKVGISLLMILLFFSVDTFAQKKKKKRKKEVQTVIQTAYSYKGTPYKYGGTSRKGIDCSALMQNSFKKAGYNIPRTAKEQSQHGKKIGWSSIQPGDVVFFKFKEKREKWYHSGIITKVGDSKASFVHASSSKGVVESNLYADYYKDNVKTFRRVIK